MKQFKALVHRSRVSDVAHALCAAGFKRLSLVDVKGLPRALNAREQEFSVALGDQVISEMQLELYCGDAQVERAVEIICGMGRTALSDAGWVHVIPVEGAYAITS